MPPHDSSVQPDALSNAMLLATAGGVLDAVVYLNHGHVFANAMTGNVIFLSIAAVGHNWHEIIPRLVPIAGFFAGVTTSKPPRTRLGSNCAILGLAFEIAALFILGWLPDTFPHMLFTSI